MQISKIFNTSKKTKIIFFTAVIIFITVIAFILFYPGLPDYYASWKIGRNYKKFEKAFIDFLKNDKYGGKTPQETYEMYVNALKKQDIELAAKYYYFEKQDREEKRLKELKEQNKLKQYADSMPKWEDMTEEEYWDKDGRRYGYKYIQEEDEKYYDPILKQERIISAGQRKGFITFLLNKHANIWKLY